MKKIVPYILLTLIVIMGFWFRLKGISTNHSFWADEAGVAGIAKYVLSGKISIMAAIKLAGMNYQPLNLIVSAIGIKLFGPTEWSTRIMTVIVNSLGIIFAYLVAKKLSNQSGGILSAFLFAFSQINLANATQAKPYAMLETFLLMIIYLLLVLTSRKKNSLLIHFAIIILLILSSLIHIIGIFFWLPYLYLIFQKMKKKWALIIIASGLTAAFLARSTIINLYTLYDKYAYFYNNLTYLRELLWKNYGFILLPAIFGLLISWKKNKNLILGLFIWIFVLLFFWNFRSYSHNIRYLVPLFGLLFVFFGIFWSHVGAKLFNKKSWIVCILVAAILYLGGNKIVRKPLIYYTPNSDLIDVQTADYKTAFNLIKRKFPNYKSLAFFNDIGDAQLYYLDKISDAYFMKDFGNSAPSIHPIDHKIVYKNLQQFLQEKSKYKRGLLFVEDWESLLPDDIKQYAKNNMKLEIDVKGLSVAEINDQWPLKVYSWGL